MIWCTENYERDQCCTCDFAEDIRCPNPERPKELRVQRSPPLVEVGCFTVDCFRETCQGQGRSFGHPVLVPKKKRYGPIFFQTPLRGQWSTVPFCAFFCFILFGCPAGGLPHSGAWASFLQLLWPKERACRNEFTEQTPPVTTTTVKCE